MQAGEIVYDVEIGTRDLLRGERAATQALDNLDKGAKQVDRSSAGATNSLTGLARAIKGVIAATALRQLAGMVQQYQTMAERVQMATDSMAEFEYVQARLQTTADGTYRALSEAQELYIRTADSLKAMGYETAALVDIQDSMSYAFVTNATSADRAQAAISQFTKAVNTGRVSADQWETITSAIPSVINDIAAASGKSAAEIRALGAAGKLAARDLTEGLRQSLEANTEAAAGMATDMTDASVRVRNAITVTLVALEEQTGAIQNVTDGIIMASEALLAFGSDSEKMAAFLDAVTIAGTATAAVIAGRLLTSLGASTAALYQNTMGLRAKAAAEVQAAQTSAALAAQNLIQAQTAERAARGLAHHATTTVALKAAQDTATAATTRLTAAAAAQAVAFRASTVAATGLRAAMTLLGGPAGIVLLAASALFMFGTRARDAAGMTELLTRETDKLTKARRGLYQMQLSKELEAQTEELERMYRVARTATGAAMADLRAGLVDLPVAAQASIDEVIGNIDRLQRRMQEVGNMNIPAPTVSGGGTDAPGETGGTAGELSEFQKMEQALKNQIELARRTGLARAELAALQRLGAEATEEERARITELVGDLHRLEQATKAAEEAERERLRVSEDAKRAAADNAGVLAGLREQLYQTTLNAEQLAQRQAELSLNSYATPDQVAEVRALAAELYAAQQEAAELERRRSAFGSDAAGAIRGDVSPLSGGMFDDQMARYEAEAAAEEQRYASQLQRLEEAKALELEVVGGYYALEEQMAQEHADRMAQIDMARTQVMLAAGEQGFGAVADMMKSAFGEQSRAYKAAFAAQKAFAIASAAINVGKAISDAAAAGWPAALAAMPAMAAATADLVGNISSVTMGGGRMHGGPVSAGNMYRVNEGGAPEVFNAANGMQYMMANQRGHVVSNADAKGERAGTNVVVNIHNAPPGTTAEQSTGQDGQDFIDVWIADFSSDGRTASAVQGKFGLQPQGR